MTQSIEQFVDGYEFLSNFYPSRIDYMNRMFPTVEHAFQAAKMTTLEDMDKIRAAKTPHDAKRLGKTLPMRPDWESIKIGVMRSLLAQKFQNPGLRDQLLKTGDAYLVEGNYWHDNFWGVCQCTNCLYKDGQNTLGKLLMEIRKDIHFQIDSKVPLAELEKRRNWK